MKKLIAIILVVGAIFLVIHMKDPFTMKEKKWIQTLSEQDQKYFLSHKELHTILNVSQFQSSKFKRYLMYQKENDSLSLTQVVQLVNQDLDTITMKYDDSIESLLEENYFIKENLKRYLDYQKEYKTDAATTVSYVNSNLDYDYYTNVQKTDFSKGILMVVNKYYMLDPDYVPDHLVTVDSNYGKSLQMQKEAYQAYQKMADDAKKKGLTLYITSPYRSYQTQSILYTNYCNRDGKDLADTYSARPGYSEHQTGLAADIVNGYGKTLSSFEDTKEFIWIKENAHRYGFILRYPEGKEKITGYQYEPWHYRYVGKEVANQIYQSNITFDEYYAYYVK